MRKKLTTLLLLFLIICVAFLVKNKQGINYNPLPVEISLEERKILNNFLEEKIFEDLLGYVLLGKKPVAWLSFPSDELKTVEEEIKNLDKKEVKGKSFIKKRKYYLE